jgi:hypothetical protein
MAPSMENPLTITTLLSIVASSKIWQIKKALCKTRVSLKMKWWPLKLRSKKKWQKLKRMTLGARP